ncbi:serine/threonine-protein kinase DBF20 NDAI_0A04760 [Naumovozyma dairenensis CBS 421]|uniref:non-specific serine/threonine protein kinase n=1 Tax=Naumovozyma dairenensis (strain ATCC 10597 / BCRC 20456 / CBS 421 / NBRC 0211 / NRRL Y-12639) TaxID=1071378 RepID=G0W494_NAUDC|nr:hypothetical protein NDAI_0A04760 [Naumovozyma dairenensis CBS 421]CCD22632.1 hypothetical protein NDAI_0A04760 [Naumovozyma dairenensis CBS 421]
MFGFEVSKKLPKNFLSKRHKPQVLRNIAACQIYFLEYYFSLFDYIITRRTRTKKILDFIEQNKGSISVMNLRNEWSSYLIQENALLRGRRQRLKKSDFEIISQIGQGGYGKVFLSRKKDTSELCALKILHKKPSLKLQQINQVLMERDILSITKSVWLVKLLYAFQDQEQLYLAMEFVPGGDFRTLLSNVKYLKHNHAEFYISEMFLAINSLHQLGYIHRDLKPENFLIDSSGHVKLTDFGLASGKFPYSEVLRMEERLNRVESLRHFKYYDFNGISEDFKCIQSNYANSVVGSVDYMAIDVLECQDYDYTVDYWSLGCILFESLVGFTPFSGASCKETTENLRHWRTKLKRPILKDGRPAFPNETWDLIKLLIADPAIRLRSIEELKNIEYFKCINFDMLRHSTPPFIPQLDDAFDTGYFDDFNDARDMEKYRNVLRTEESSVVTLGTSSASSRITGFTFRHKTHQGILRSLSDDGTKYVDAFATFF